MADHEPGKMNVDEHEKTFAGFIRVGVIGIVVVIGALLFLALVNS